MAKVSNKDIYTQDENLSMEDYLLGTNNGTANKKTQTYSLGSIFSLFYNFLGFNAFLNTTDTTTYPIGTPGCFYVFDENDDLTNDFALSRKITFSATDTYNFNVASYFDIIVNSNKFLFKLINLEDKNNFVFLAPSNFVLGLTGTTFEVNVDLQEGLSSGTFVSNKRYLLVLEFASGIFNASDYDLTDFTNTSGNPFATIQDITDALDLFSTIESVTISNRWSLTNTNEYYRSRADYAGFNDMILNNTTVFHVINQTVASLSAALYTTAVSKKITKILVDGSNVAAGITELKLGVFAFQRATVTDPNFSAVNLINLGEFTLTKTNGVACILWQLTPSNIEIPSGYLVSCVLMKTAGTGSEVNTSITFKFEDYAV